MTIPTWLNSPEWTNLVRALLHTLWQGTLIATLLGLTLRRVTNPAVRYRCALGALAGTVIVGLITWGILCRPLPHTDKVAPAAVPVTTATMATVQSDLPPIVVTVVPPKQEVVEVRWTAWLALVWLAGASAMLGRAGFQLAGAERLRRSARPLDDPRLADLLAGACRAVKLARRIRLAVTDKLTSPVVAGVLAPTLILPLTLTTTLSPEQIRFILLHELAHIRRGDYLANLFQLFAEALLFFNPAVWWISRQMRLEREACCDALAVELSGAPADYARTLVCVAENVLCPPPSALPALGSRRNPSSLADRVQRMLVPGYRPALRLTWRAMFAALLTGGTLLFLSALGTRLTLAALPDAKARAGSQQDSNQPVVSTEAPFAATLKTMTFKLEHPIGQAALRQALAAAGVQLPTIVFFYTDSGVFLVRGTPEHLALVNGVVRQLYGYSTNNAAANARNFIASLQRESAGSQAEDPNRLFMRTFKLDKSLFFRPCRRP